MRHIAANAITILILIGIIIVGMIGYGANEFSRPGDHEAAVVTLERGDGLNTVSERLEDAGVISDARIFRLAARYLRRSGEIKWGEYEIPAGASMEEVLAMLVDGRTVQHKVTVPEGLTSWEIVERLKEVEVLIGEIPVVPAEGSLAPETYFVQRGEKREAVLKRMQDSQAAILDAAWESRAPDLPLRSKEEALILASIVEKETGVASERERVAAVFINRLRLGMKLQTDPTVIYGVTEGKGSLGRGLRRSELDGATPYNTYVIEGLPPTPIANPGKAAILATLNPSETDELYFVADGTGGHVFAKSLDEHNRNVAKWRKIEAEQQKSQ